MVQKQINDFVQINCTDNFGTADVTTRLLMDFGCVSGDQQNLYTTHDICVIYSVYCESCFILDGDDLQFRWKIVRFKKKVWEEMFTSVFRLQVWLIYVFTV